MEKHCNDYPESQSHDSGSPWLWGLNPLVVDLDSVPLPDLHSRREDPSASCDSIDDLGTEVCSEVDSAAPSKVQDDVNDRKDHRNISSSDQDGNHSKINLDTKDQRASLISLENDSDESGRVQNDSQDGRNEEASETDHDTLKGAAKAKLHRGQAQNIPDQVVDSPRPKPVEYCPSFAPSDSHLPQDSDSVVEKPDAIDDQNPELDSEVGSGAPSKVQDDVNDRKDHRNISSSHQDRNHSKINPDAKEQRAGLSSLKNDSDESGRAENDSQDGRNEGASETDHNTLKEAAKAIPNLGVDDGSGLKLEPVACCPNFAPLKYIRHSGQCLPAMSDEDISKLTLTTTTNVSHSDGEQPGETETLNWVQHSSSSGNRVLVFKVNSGSLHTKMLKLRKGKDLESIIILEKLENNSWSISIQIAVYRITFSKCVGQSVEDTENVGSQKRITNEEPNYRVNIDISIGGKGKVLSWNVPLMSKTRGNTKRAIPPPIRKRHLESYYEFMMHVPEGLGVVQLKAEDIEYLGSNDRDVSRKEHEEATKRLRVR